MTSPDASAGPFRRDARVERVAECPPAQEAMDFVRRSMGIGLDHAAYVAMIGLTTLASVFALPGRPAVGGIVALTLLVSAWRLQVQRKQLWVATEDAAVAFPRRCLFLTDVLVLEGACGRTEFDYRAIRAIRQRGDLIAIELHSDQWIAIRAGGDPLFASWLTARSPRLARGASSRRFTLLLLAVLYVLLVAASVTVLPSVVAP